MLKDSLRELLVSLFALFTSPSGGIIRAIDNARLNDEMKGINEKIEKLQVAINAGIPLEDDWRGLVALLVDKKILDATMFRKHEYCILISKMLNLRSKNAQENDPLIMFSDLCEILSSSLKNEYAEDQVFLALYELEQNDLIYKHPDMNSRHGFGKIGPRSYFFCRTDHLFKSWWPQKDAELIIHQFVNGEAVRLMDIDSKFNWGARRLNSAVAYLHYKGLICHDHELGGPSDYILTWFRFNEEAKLLIGS